MSGTKRLFTEHAINKTYGLGEPKPSGWPNRSRYSMAGSCVDEKDEKACLLEQISRL